MRRNYWVVVANAVCAVALAGCHDASLVAPTAEVSAAPTVMARAPEGRPSFDFSAGIGGASTGVDFIVGPGGGSYSFGDAAVSFPAGSICDPATSSYGAGEWDAPCSRLTHNIQVHAELRTVDGRMWVDFSPAMRFVPSSNPRQWVFVMMQTPGAVGASLSDLGQFNILYASSIGGAVENDAVTDPSMRTYVDTNLGYSIRRVKHFSGYTASAGFVCNPGSPDCGGPVEEAPAPASP